MYDYDREYVRRTTPIYGDLRAARYADADDEGYVPLSPTHPLSRHVRSLGAPWVSRYDVAFRRYGMPGGARRSRYGAADYGAFRPAARAYDSGFESLRPGDPLARALREDAEGMVAEYLRGERYGEEYARTLGRRIRGRGDRLRAAARRMVRSRYDRDL